MISAAVLFAACTATPPAPPAIRFNVPIADGRVLSSFAVSPDGARLVYSAESVADGRRHLVRRLLASDTAADEELANTTGATAPFFSPDGSAVAYFSRGAIWHTPVLGGTPTRVVDAPADSAGGAWTPDGRIVFAPLGNMGLMAVAAGGGGAVAITELNTADGEIEHGWPYALPDGSIAFTVSQRGRDPHIEVVSADRKRARLRVPIIGQAQFVQTGHLVYSFLGNLMAVRFNTEEHTTDGVPVIIAQGIQTSSGYGALGHSGFAVSRTGTLVWLRAGADEAKSRLVRVDRDGNASPLPAPADVMQTPRLSPDGRRIAVVARSGVMTRDIRVLDNAHAERVVLTIAGGDNQSPAWLDARRLTFGSNRDGLQKIYIVNVEGTRPPEPLFTADATAARNPASWADRVLALYEIEPARGRDVLVYRVGESIAPVAATDANERSPSVSPDGLWIAYVSDATGRDEVYVARLDGARSTAPTGGGDVLKLTGTGATEPAWSREGLLYREGESMVLRPLQKGTFAEPRVLFEGHFERDPGANLAAYDVDRQGRFFIMLKSAAQPRELRVVKNWWTELP